MVIVFKFQIESTSFLHFPFKNPFHLTISDYTSFQTLAHRKIAVLQSYQSKPTQILILLLFSCSFYCLSHCFLISCVYNHPKISLFFKAAPTFNLSMYNLSSFGDPLRIISPSQAPPPPSEKLKYIRFINQGVVSSQLM